MAARSLDYSVVPSVQPGGIPDAKARVQTSPDMFGAGIARETAGLGQAFSQAGAQAFNVAQFYSQVAADDGYNQLIENTNRLMHGDPNTPLDGPNGQTPDLGFMGLKGAAALDGRKNAEERLDKIISDIGGGLDPMAQKHFNQISRRYRTQVAERIASHADNQAGVYYSSVNKATADANLAAIALSPSDEGAVKLATDNLINARVKQAQLAGGTQENIDQAVRSAKQDALKTRVLTISATDPAGARTLLEQNRETAGTDYASLYDHVRSRADHQIGIGVGNEVFAKTKGTYADARLPIFTQASQSVPGSMSPQGLARLVKIESGGKPTAGVGRAHQGLVQASEQWWTQFGRGSRLDPEQSIMAAARATAHDRPILAKALGHAPTDAELYLAHQQGPGGAIALLSHPDLPAADALVAGGAYKSRAAAAAAIRGNAGDPNAPASQFTSMWTAKFGGQGLPTVTPFGGAPARLPESMSGVSRETAPIEEPTLAAEQPPLTITKADAYRDIMARTDISDEAKSYAMQHFNQIYAAQQVADAADEKAKHELSDKIAQEVMTRIGAGATPQLIAEIYNNPAIDWRTKHTLVEIATKKAGIEDTTAFGPGYDETFQRIVAPAGSPERINDPQELLPLVADGHLTQTGWKHALDAMNNRRHSVEGSGVVTAKAGMLAYGKQQLVVDETMSFGNSVWKDQKGLSIYNSEFIPKFEAAYLAWTGAGKNPFEFLTKENIDKIIAPLRSKTDLAKAKIEAGIAANEAAPTVPSPPAGIDETKWQPEVSRPPLGYSVDRWGKAIERLVATPTIEMQEAFDRAYAPRHAKKAGEILKALGVETRSD